MSHDDLDGSYPIVPLTPPEGWSLENVPLADLSPRTELIRGVLVMNPQTAWHEDVVWALQLALEEHCPRQYVTQYRMAIRKSSRTAPEPDLSVVHRSAFDLDKSIYLPEDVVLVAEVVTPESEERDREDKPALYAMMGIRTFWLVERGEDDAPIVYEHKLSGNAYRLGKTHTGRLSTKVPFPIDIPLTAPTG